MSSSQFCLRDPMSNASVTVIPGSNRLEFHRLQIRFCPCKVGPNLQVSVYYHDGYCPLNPECPWFGYSLRPFIAVTHSWLGFQRAQVMTLRYKGDEWSCSPHGVQELKMGLPK